MGSRPSLRTTPTPRTPMNPTLQILMIRSPPLIFPCSTPAILINAPKSSKTSTKPARSGLVNHGVPETLMKAVLDGCNEFFNLPMEEKMEFATKDIWKPIRFGTGVDTKVEKILLLEGLHQGVLRTLSFTFSANLKAAQEYCKRCREVSMELLKGISESLGFEETYIEKAMDLKSGFQLFAANLYPPCPQPELAMGIPAHTDHGLLTLLIENGIGGLQIQHNGKWFHVNPLPQLFPR
ncbi:hypothetical protein Acr_00g0050910 [Actinidia rufa]|uniref:2-oxoglutarate (2OG) and Fe(II)-dependent oxygenase superfamily protein n=1 Tax=Actinidia rufa TaxID=165716 RepID=A0A7J0DKM2_9ERIC|nr:hypothetical protein Acr_00g0050910 [Actinidia rufa]